MEAILRDVITLDQINEMQRWFLSRPPDIIKHKSDGRRFHEEWRIDEFGNDPASVILQSIIDPILPNARLFSGAYRESHFPFGFHIDTSQESWDALPGMLENTPGMVAHDTAVIIPFDGGAGSRTVIFDVSTRTWEPGQTRLYASNMYNGLDPLDFGHIADEIDRSNISKLPLLIDYQWEPGSMVLWKRDRLHTAADFMEHSASKKAVTMFFW